MKQIVSKIYVITVCHHDTKYFISYKTDYNNNVPPNYVYISDTFCCKSRSRDISNLNRNCAVLEIRCQPCEQGRK